MARNIKRYGYAPNRTSDTPYTIVMSAHRKAYARFTARREARAQRKAARVPLTDAQRVWNYVRQIGVRRPLTPAQQRRRTKKMHRQPGLLNGVGYSELAH